MFWTDWGRNPRIERASMDGKMRTTIISNKLYWPNGLTIDYPNNLLYFADAYLDFIDFCDYNGNNRKQVLASDLVRKRFSLCVTVVQSVGINSIMFVKSGNIIFYSNASHGFNQKDKKGEYASLCIVFGSL